jgi:hypothetical protein
MPRRENMRLQFFDRLHRLQNLYCAGKFAPGSPRHFELLALETLESLYVQNEMRRAGQVAIRVAEHGDHHSASTSC